MTKHAATLDQAVAALRAELAAAAETARTHATELATERARYDGLSRQLLRETAHQRETFQSERQRLEGELARAAQRLQALESLREHLLTELAGERNHRQLATAEAVALSTVIEQQRQTLAPLGTATSGRQAQTRRCSTGRAAATAKRTRPANAATGLPRKKAR